MRTCVRAWLRNAPGIFIARDPDFSSPRLGSVAEVKNSCLPIIIPLRVINLRERRLYGALWERGPDYRRDLRASKRGKAAAFLHCVSNFLFI